MALENQREAFAEKLLKLVGVVQELSLAKRLDTIMAIVRHAARELTGADGATFVLRDDGKCYYADEEAIAPLWKGLRFPMDICISGWAMQNKTSCAIEDIYADPRIPAEAYRPTFVKSLLMVPIRTLDPIGAIGNYWAVQHKATEHEIRLLQALADTTAVAMENVRIYDELEQRVQQRTTQLEHVNQLLRQENVERKRIEHQVRRQAITDPLTGLLNRRGFFQAAKARLGEIREGTECAIVFLDVDGLKTVNDTLGHESGDKLIIAAAEVVRTAFDRQIMARIGGDEFAVMIEDRARFGSVCDRVQALADDYMAQRHPPFTLSVSVGVAEFEPSENVSLDDMLMRADGLMYENKRAKRRVVRKDSGSARVALQ